MFLIDSCNCRKTEPTWFGVFRCGFAFVLTCIILKFSAYDNFNKIFRQSILEQVDVPKGEKRSNIISPKFILIFF